MDGRSEAVRMWLIRPMRGGVAFLRGLGTNKVSHCSVRLVDVDSFPPLSLGLAYDSWDTDSSKLGTFFYYLSQGWSFRRLQDDIFSNEILNVSVSTDHPFHHLSMNFYVFIQIRCVLIFISLLLNILSLYYRELHRNKINRIEPAAFNGLTNLDRL